MRLYDRVLGPLVAIKCRYGFDRVLRRLERPSWTACASGGQDARRLGSHRYGDVVVAYLRAPRSASSTSFEKMLDVTGPEQRNGGLGLKLTSALLAALGAGREKADRC